MGDDLEITRTAEGECIILRPSAANLRLKTIVHSTWALLASFISYWSGPAIVKFFSRGEVTGPLQWLNRYQLSETGMKAAVIVGCFVLAWFGLGGVYEVLKVQLQKDTFLLRADSLIVRRRKLRTREFVFPSYEPVGFRLGTSNGEVEAKSSRGVQELTDCGTLYDRNALVELLCQRYKAGVDMPAVAEKSHERVGTYIVERHPGGRIVITSSKLSTVGCAWMAAAICVALLILSASSMIRNELPGIVIPLMLAAAIAYAGISSLNRRKVEASRGRIRVEWDSPAGKLLQRFFSKDSLFLKHQFGEGTFERQSGTLRVKKSSVGKNSVVDQIVLIHKSADALEGDDPGFSEDVVLTAAGHGSEYTAHHLVRLLSEVTGFPNHASSQA